MQQSSASFDIARLVGTMNGYHGAIRDGRAGDDVREMAVAAMLDAPPWALHEVAYSEVFRLYLFATRAPLLRFYPN